MTEQKPFDMHDYLAIGLRRKWYIIIPLIIGVLASVGVYKYLPKIYKTTTLILVQPQAVPENYVRSTITDSVTNRLNTISQEILSRTRLEKVIQEFNLYAEIRKKLPLEEIIEVMRKAIEVKVQDPRRDQTTNSFSISYEGEEPKTVMMVTNKLASLFIEENLKVRESRAEGTSEFLIKELENMEQQLKQKEYNIRSFKERSMGQLPQQLDANLRILEQLQQQLRTISEKIRASEDRAILIQGQLEQLKNLGPRGDSLQLRGDSLPNQEAMNTPRIREDLVGQLNALKRELASMLTRLKEAHPDVINLKRRIAALESQAEEESKLSQEKERITTENLPASRLNSDTEGFTGQMKELYNSAQLETKRLKEEEKNLKEQMSFYQRRIEITPQKEEQLMVLTRDYDLLKTNYQSLLDKKIQAQMAENLERKQQGEQFKILDPARLPEKPFKPNRNKVLLIGAVLGLVAGLGLAWFRESLDQTFHTVSDVEDYLGISVIATIPNLKEEEKKAA